VQATAQQDVLLEVFGADPEGAVVAEGMIRLPVSGGAAVGKLLGRVLDGLARMGAPPTAKPQPANAKQPWTADLDEELREAWLTQTDRVPVADLIRSLADRMGRSPTSIRSRLPRVGCDPDIVGRPLSPDAAQVLGVTP
jgi:hypothetical protein